MDNFKINEKILNLVEETEDSLKNAYKEIEITTAKNESKVLKAFLDCKISATHFIESTGYGYGDCGREKLDELFSKIFDSEDALVRANFVSGTHTIATALFAILKANDTILSITGTPYPTIRKTLGIEKTINCNSLCDFGVTYKEINILTNNIIDIKTLTENLDENVKVVYIQRSKGYTTRNSITIEQIEQISNIVHSNNNKSIVFVDNCYGEFVEDKEPTQVGADLVCGSLIKNPGGGIAKSGGYIVGKKKFSKAVRPETYCSRAWKRNRL